ncbi:hypothetical protein NIES2119_23255 [[Phormidium ambiguum] IAM M-71]|uniref:Uncharacterized protein n=1 Tax=[Phormidium ambiguum] IAM M-71 TaxID=454136 RepID=A0A1U7IAH6_9CYAN|nr:hypothetical protein NIES2119_23255 [Phormidium ambiguum IAM M-71]
MEPPTTPNPPVSNQPPTNDSGDIVASNPTINEVVTRGAEIVQSTEQQNQQSLTEQNATPLPERCRKRGERSNVNNQNASSQEEEECEELSVSERQRMLRQGILRLEPQNRNGQSNPQSLPESLTGGKGGNATEIRNNGSEIELRGSGVQIDNSGAGK